MVKKKELNRIIDELTGGIRKRFVIQGGPDRKNRYEAKFSNDYTIMYYVTADDSDLLFLRILYEKRKPSVFTYRGMIKGWCIKYVVSAGTFTPRTTKSIIDGIMDEGLITNIQFIIGLKIYDTPDKLRRKITIGKHTIYVSTCEDCYQWVDVTEDGIQIEKINRSTGIPYETEPNSHDTHLSRKSRESINQNTIQRQILSFGAGQ